MSTLAVLLIVIYSLTVFHIQKGVHLPTPRFTSLYFIFISTNSVDQ